jgi:ABC-type uncharacterized transport system permease subunit
MRMRRISSFIAIVIGLAGCAVTSIDGVRMPLGSDSFADYVEAVFRGQNELATAIAAAIDDLSPGSERYAVLENAELELLAACRGLNQLARARRDGESAGGLGGLKRAREAPACERATDRIAALL